MKRRVWLTFAPKWTYLNGHPVRPEAIKLEPRGPAPPFSSGFEVLLEIPNFNGGPRPFRNSLGQDCWCFDAPLDPMATYACPGAPTDPQATSGWWRPTGKLGCPEFVGGGGGQGGMGPASP